MNTGAIIFLSEDNVIHASEAVTLCLYGANECTWQDHTLGDSVLTSCLAATSTLIIAIPSSLAFNIALSITHSESRHLKNTLPYLLEDFLAEDIDNFNYCHRYDPQQKQLDAIAINKDVYMRLESLCEEFSLPYDYITTDLQLLPLNNNQLIIHDEFSITSDEARIKRRFSARQASTFIPRSLSKETPVNCVNLSSTKQPKDLISELESQGFRLTDVGDEWNQSFHHHGTLIAPAKLEDISPLIIKSSTESTDKKLSTVSKLNKITAIAAIACIFSVLAYDLVLGYIYAHKTKILEQQAIAIYRQHFPGDKRVFDVKRQLEGKLSSRKEQTKSIFYTALEAIARIKPRDAYIGSVNFDDKSNEVLISISSKKDSDIDNFRSSLTKELHFNTLSLSENQNTTTGKFLITGEIDK